jgi:hypothetical protein
LAFVVTETRILITLNCKHFVRLHQVQAGHEGIIVCTFDPDFRALAQRVHAALMARPQMAGRLARINRPG